MGKGFSIAIDGPVAAGKGTIAAALANILHGFSINTGAMYRCVALLCMQSGLDVSREKDAVWVLRDLNIEFKKNLIFLNGVNVTERLKEADVASGSSVVAVYEKVRDDLVIKQRQIAESLIAKGKIIIAEGRDTGTRVLPKADLKIFLTANVAVRAKRSLNRYKQKGIIKRYEEVLEETKTRDYRDSHREIDPLPLEPEQFGYWALDNSNQSEAETVNAIMVELRERKLIR